MEISHTITGGDCVSDEVQVAGIRTSNSENTYTVMAPMQMHGRRTIYTNETEITAGNVIKVLNDALRVHVQNRSEEVYLEKYLRGIQPIIDRVKVYNKEICNRIVVNIANQIVTFKTSEFAGEPIQYISRGSKKSVPKKVEKLNSLMLSEGKQSKDMDLAYKMFTCGVGYRLVLNDKAGKDDLYDEAPFEIYTPDPRNTFVIRLNGVSKKVMAGVTYVFLDEAQQKVLYTVYTDTMAFQIEGSTLNVGTIKKTDKHNLGYVPIIEYPCNSIQMGAFEVVLDLLDAYNLCLSDRMDGIDQFIQALLVLEGVDVSREQLTEMKDLGAIKIPPSMDGRNNRIYYLNEQLDQSQTQTLVDDMYHTILQIVGMPSQGNANTSDSSNNGAILMKNGWWNAEARALETEGMWKQAETEFLKIVLKICRDANVLDGLSVSDVEPKFGRRSYEDLLVKTQSFSTLRSAGCPSIQAFTFSKLSKDPESDALAFDEYQQEKEDALNEMSTIGGAAPSGSETSYSDDEESEEGEDSEGSGGGDYATCPVCKRRFKRKGNQVYDREECRRIARRQKRGGMI